MEAITSRAQKYGRRRVSRPAQLGLNITDEKMAQLHRLRELTRWTIYDIIEEGLDLFEVAWKEGKYLHEKVTR